jgi:SPP1 gp7 family putative phage head morphogenesis protein
VLEAIGRLFGSAPPAPKAETGPGVFAMSAYPQLTNISRHPAKLMAEAQVLFHANPWVAQAERAIYGRYVQTPLHLEDSNGNTVDAKASGPAKVAHDLLTKPSDTLSRRSLWALTMRHQGLCGNAFWYLDQRDSTFGVPLQLLYINPARMTPVESQAGKLLGWIMDAGDNPVTSSKNLRNAVPFELEEIRHFKLDEPDWGHYGIGIAEAAYTQIKLDEYATHHASGVIASGGRIAGLVSPKPNVVINDDQWAAMVRDWRNITSDPDSAKRLLVVKGPVDFTSTAASPQQMEMVELLRLNRENVFAAWGVGLSVGAGVIAARGLNSGETMKFEEAALWQGPIEFRSGPFEEQVQSILDLFGIGLRLVVEKPAFDDQAPLFENASKSTKQPLTNNERRALLGFDPLEDDEIGSMIFIEKTMVPLPPAPPSISFGGPPPSEEEEAESSGLGEAAQPVKADLRATLTRQWEPKLQEAVQGFLAKQAVAIANRVKRNHAHIVAKPSDVRSWWNERQWNAELTEILEPLLGEMAGKVSRTVAKPLPAKADSFLDRVIAIVRRAAGLRIGGINQTTRDSVARLIESGIEQGLSPGELAQQVRDATAFNEARAEVIARTETATAYNEAALHTYREFEVREVEAIDGDTDAECAARNGQRYPIDEALGISDHPNGTLDWVPVVEGKAQAPDPMYLMAESVKAVLERPLPTPTVNVYPEFSVQAAKAPDVQIFPEAPVVNLTVPERAVTIEPAVVNVTMPEQPPPNITVEAKAQLPAQVEITGLPTRYKRAKRTTDGNIESMIETDG